MSGSGKYYPRYAGRVHLQFWDKTEKAWRFVCGKRDGGRALLFGGAAGNVIDDGEPITCLSCTKHAPDIVEAMDVVPDLDEFQDDQFAFVDDAIDRIEEIP